MTDSGLRGGGGGDQDLKWVPLVIFTIYMENNCQFRLPFVMSHYIYTVSLFSAKMVFRFSEADNAITLTLTEGSSCYRK